MGYRGEDVSRMHGARGGHTPWQPSSGTGPGATGPWDDNRPQDYPQGGYPQDNRYPSADGFGYGGNDGYPEHGQPGYGQPEYGQYDDHGSPATPGRPGPGGYGGPGYAHGDDYGYQQGEDTYGYGQAGYDQRPEPGYGSGGGGYYPPDDAGNDWYGGQPAAANGASFADTGSYALNGRIIDEYGTGPRGALRDPVRGFPPGNGQPGTGPQSMGQLPAGALPTASGPHAVARTGQQERYDDYPPYRDYPQDEPSSRTGRSAGDSYQGAGYQDTGRDEYNGYDGFGARDGYADEDPYQDRYGDDAADGAGGRARRGAGKSGPDGQSSPGPLGGKRMLLAALAVVAVGVIGVAAYFFVLNPRSTANNPNAQGPLPTGSAVPSQQAACAQKLGMYCHIDSRTDDPTPLTTAELFPPAFANEKDKSSYSLVSTKVDKTCSNAVIGQDLIKALSAGKCTQALRASYVSGDSKIMGTIGVINLATTNEAHYAGRVVTQNDFVAPLTASKGVASKLGNGTGVVQSEYKGHYLILTWSEFVNGTTPSTTAQKTQLEQFGNDLIAGTANISLSERMVTGAPPTAGAV